MHFIEIGFQIDPTSFIPLHTHNELHFDSMARKYIYEFTSLHETKDIVQIEKKLRQQISENQALFTEISPVYISLNMGRPIVPLGDGSKGNEEFRLVDREACTVNGQQLTINFLKSDFPYEVLRLIGFNNNTCQSYSCDLTRDDLHIICEGNTRLLEEENLKDLCQVLLNQVTLIRRNMDGAFAKQRKADGKSTTQDVLAVEHRCFFNKDYR